MALPKTKVKERLGIKFPGVNLSNKRLAALADKIKLEQDADDEAIDEKLDELNEIYPFTEIAKTDDRLRTLEKEKKDNPDPDPDPKKDPAPDPKKDESDVAAIINKALSPLLTEIANLKADKVTGTRQSQLNAVLEKTDDKFKKSINGAFKRMKGLTDEDFEEYLEEVTEQAKEFVQASADESLSSVPLPVLGVKNKSGISTDTSAYIAEKQAAAEGKGSVAGKAIF